ncbi:DUF305 domain-containing protein [Rubrobacter indicoceani]|uniref:DUF305 domain-containing protein n=1 Tax=Rubrobacter indicoceani TaxID=2051957 RepID=UPI001F09F8D2|nr:DUF305 domain-containing protein [Rubrobacter indicoceani]
MILATAAVLVAAAVVLFVTQRMPDDSSAEAGFARDMAVHHAQAVEIASIVESRTENEEVRTLASDIVLTQQAQIGQMQGWLAVWELPQTGSEEQMAWMGHEMQAGELMPGMATRNEIISLSKLPPDDMDTEFLRLLVEHHSAAIPMANAVLDQTNRPEVETLARAIVSSQRTEISVMNNMLRRMGEDPVPTQNDMQDMDM